MDIRAAEISRVIKDQIANFGTEAEVSEVGPVLSVGDALGPSEGGGGAVNVEPDQPVTIEIPQGSTGQDIGAILSAQGVVRSALEFEVAVRNVDAAQRLQAGTYELTTLMDPADVVAELVSGPGAPVYRVTIIEGLRINEILTRLSESTGHSYADYEEALRLFYAGNARAVRRSTAPRSAGARR